MRMVTGRREARWFPSRHSSALFRLAAYVRLRNAAPEPADVTMVIDPHQSAVETWCVGLWILLTTTCFLAASLFSGWSVPLAMAISLVIAVAVVHAALFAAGLVVTPLWQLVAGRTLDRTGVNSVVIVSFLSGAAAYFATRPTWVRYVAWQYLGALGINAVAAVVVFAMRDSIARLEANVGGESSGG